MDESDLQADDIAEQRGLYEMLFCSSFASLLANPALVPKLPAGGRENVGGIARDYGGGDSTGEQQAAQIADFANTCAIAAMTKLCEVYSTTGQVAAILDDAVNLSPPNQEGEPPQDPAAESETPPVTLEIQSAKPATSSKWPTS